MKNIKKLIKRIAGVALLAHIYAIFAIIATLIYKGKVTSEDFWRAIITGYITDLLIILLVLFLLDD